MADSNTLKAVIYARYSSHGQTEQSIEGQLRICKEYADRENCIIIGEYIDRAIPGKTDNRPDFQRMISDSKKKQFDYVIVYKLDRFARNRYDSAIYKHKLKKNGVRLLSAMENIGDNPESIILEAVLEASAEYYSVDLSQKVKRGMKESILKGQCTGGIPLYGYKYVDRKVCIDEDKAPIIKHVFEEYAKGKVKKKIIEELNEKGVRNRAGNPLSLTSFQDSLRNKKYIGIFTHQGVEYTNIYPPLIDKDIFDKVQERLTSASHAPASAKAKVDYQLRGKVFCGHCGTRMVGENGRSRSGEKYYYYACSKKKKQHTCDKKNEKKDFLEWYVVEQTVLYVLTPQRMEYIAERVVEEYDKEFNVSKEIELQRQINKIERDIDKCFNMIMESDSIAIKKRSEKKIQALELQKTDLEIDLSKLKIANDIRLKKEDIIAWLNSFSNGDLSDENYRCRVIDAFVKSVYIYDNKCVTYYNIRDSKQISYIDNCETLDNSKKEEFIDSLSVRISNGVPSQGTALIEQSLNIYP